MLMNRFETLAMNNPLRALMQDRIELHHLRHISDLPPEKTVLEIGCGNGYGTKLINKYFRPKEIFAIDLDPKMIALAQKNHNRSNLHFAVGDASKLPYRTAAFDAIFDFGIIHHIINWGDCLHELKRVLKPGGKLIIEDLSIETFTTPFGKLIKPLLDHPYKDMFKRTEFINELKKTGFQIEKYEIHYPFKTIQYFDVLAKKI